MPLSGGCGREPPAERRAIEAIKLPGCPLDDVVALELSALDDGPPSAAAFAEVSLSAPSDLPTFPASARAFVARGRDAAGALVAWGVFDVDDRGARGPLFRVGRPCSLLAARVPALPSPSVGASDRWVLLAGGHEPRGVARSDLVAIDARAAAVTRSGLRRRRAGATVIVLDRGAVVAGGESDGAAWEDAEWIDTTVTPPSVSRDAVALAEPRAMAAGVRLVSGEGLLVGGVGPRGPLATLEAFDPVRRAVRTVDLARLSRPRRSPVAVRLLGGAIAVLGGFDASGAPVPDVEVFDPTAARRLVTLPLPARERVTATSLPSGAALVVRGDAGSDLEPVLLRVDGIEAWPAPPAGPEAPRLVAATDGAPLLWDGAFRRYDPWTGRFREAPLPGSFRPDVGIEPLPLADGAGAVVRAADETAGSGPTFELAAVRYDVRTPWVVDPEPLGLGSTAHLVPDRLDVRVGREGLVLSPHARVAVADATYGAFTARLGASGRALPAVELRTPDGALVARIGDETPDECRWPVGLADTAEITRTVDGAIVVRIGDAASQCAPRVAAERVTITLVAGAREARVRGLTVTRG